MSDRNEKQEQSRINDAASQLKRYGHVADVRLLDVLDLLNDINDDMTNGRQTQCVSDNIEKAEKLLKEIDQDNKRVSPY